MKEELDREVTGMTSLRETIEEAAKDYRRGLRVLVVTERPCVFKVDKLLDDALERLGPSSDLAGWLEVKGGLFEETYAWDYDRIYVIHEEAWQ